ncbi:hypothetical protein EDB80DRAFT_755440 [Ilyonectria destructans]|nr:hypothetical protein EDB80DRAFT_755440 [Ilyonectria destructans]
MNVDVRLKEPIEQAFNLKQQNLSKHAESIDYFFTHFQIDTFPSFINIKRIYLIPEIINMPEISLEPAVVVLYYSILYYGSMVIEDERDPQGGNLSQWIYGCCLRALPAWRERVLVLGTKTNLSTPILLMRASFQKYDLDFSWDMYKLVFECGLVSAFIPPEDGEDHSRKGLWAPGFVDLFFSLLHDKPAIIGNLIKWRVNFPGINTDPEHPQHVVPTLAFFVKSRLTFLPVRFFDPFSEEEEDRNYVIKRIEGLCVEIEDLAKEWSVKDSMDANDGNVSGWWALYELTLTANCIILIMSRKMEVLQSELSGTSRYPACASYTFGAFRCYMPYSCLAKQLFNGDPKEPGSTALTDMEIPEQIAGTMNAIAGKNDDILPLARTLHELNIGVYAKWKTAR